jgi:hypothetical protein
MAGLKGTTLTAAKRLCMQADSRREDNLITITLPKYPKISTQTFMLSHPLHIQRWEPVLSKDMCQSATHIVQHHTICTKTMETVAHKVLPKHR